MFEWVCAGCGLGNIEVAIEIGGAVGFGGLVAQSARACGTHITISISKENISKYELFKCECVDATYSIFVVTV